MKLKGDPINESMQTLGEANEQEFTFLLLPIKTYKMIADKAKQEGCTAAQVFEKAVLQYLREGDQAGKTESVVEKLPRIEPAMVFRRSKP